MFKKLQSRIWATSCLLVIFFVPFSTALTETGGNEAKLSMQFSPVSPSHDSRLEFRLDDEEATLDILLSESDSESDSESEPESESESTLPCNWEWWMYANPDCATSEPYNDGSATSDLICLQNCDGGATKSYQKVCVSYEVDEDDSQSLTATVWYRHGCSNCPPIKEENDTSSLNFDRFNQLLVAKLPSVNASGWMTGDLLSFGLFDLNATTHAKPGAQFEAKTSSTYQGIVNPKNSLVNFVRVLNSHTRVAVHRLSERSSDSIGLNLATDFGSESRTTPEKQFRFVQ